MKVKVRTVNFRFQFRTSPGFQILQKMDWKIPIVVGKESPARGDEFGTGDFSPTGFLVNLFQLGEKVMMEGAYDSWNVFLVLRVSQVINLDRILSDLFKKNSQRVILLVASRLVMPVAMRLVVNPWL